MQTDAGDAFRELIGNPDGRCHANNGEHHQRNRHEFRGQKDKARYRCRIDDLGDAGLPLAPHDLGAEQDRQHQQHRSGSVRERYRPTMCVIGSSGVP